MRLVGWIGVLLAAVGCQSSSKAPYAENPLLMSREPLKQTAAASKPEPAPNVAKSMPSAPPPSVFHVLNQGQPGATKSSTALPTSTSTDSVKQVVASSAPPATPTTSTPATPRLPEPTSAPPVPAAPLMPAPTPAPAPPVQSAPPPPLPPVPPPPATQTPPLPPARYAHAKDYGWLVGEIDVHYRGHKELRFCPVSEENSIGGKVRLVDDPRLADLKPGTIVWMDGELVRDDPTAAPGEYPRYHIRNIQVVPNPTK